MEPGNKFMTPRPPPAPPALKRLQSSPAPLLRKRMARSISPKPPGSPWSPMAFFGLRSASPYVQDGDRRGRSSSSLTKPAESLVKPIETNRNFIRPQSNRSLSDEERRLRIYPRKRDVSPQTFVKTGSREPSPLRQFVAQETTNHKPTVLVIPDEIEEEAEDDDNFASEMSRMSLHDKILTPLAPRPSGLRFPTSDIASRADTPKDTSKPLPLLPAELVLALSPSPLRLRAPVPSPEVGMSKSHFSMSTISTISTSPTDSHFEFSDTPSIVDSNEDEDLSADIDSEDESLVSPVKDVQHPFTGYSLPDSDYTSAQSLQKDGRILALTQVASRTTFGSASPFVPSTETDVKATSALEELLNEMGYLGDAITGK